MASATDAETPDSSHWIRAPILPSVRSPMELATTGFPGQVLRHPPMPTRSLASTPEVDNQAANVPDNPTSLALALQIMSAQARPSLAAGSQLGSAFLKLGRWVVLVRKTIPVTGVGVAVGVTVAVGVAVAVLVAVEVGVSVDVGVGVGVGVAAGGSPCTGRQSSRSRIVSTFFRPNWSCTKTFLILRCLGSPRAGLT